MFAFVGERPRKQDPVRGARLTIEIGADFAIGPSELLFVREEPVRGDLAMVFGAANEMDLIRRTRQGVRLYQQGYVSRLLVTGGGTLANRVLLTVQKTFPHGLRFVCCPTLEGCTRETWAAVKECRAEVLQEWELVVAFREAGLL